MGASIEQLPNELLMKIFQYLPTKNLYESFYNLNLRFNALIDALNNLSWTMEEDWDCPTGRIPMFASRIQILTIKHDEPIDLTSFPHIHSLKLLMPTAEQCRAIQPRHLPHLKDLFIANFFFSDHSEHVCPLLFSSQFPHLERCQIDRMTLPSLHSHSSLSLRQLTLSPSTWNSNHYPPIFNACPNLFSLRLIRLRKIAFSIDRSSIEPHASLRDLFIQFHSVHDDCLEHLDYLLSFAPKLQSLYLSIQHNESENEFPFERFAKLLIRHVPNLISIRAKIPLNRLFTTELPVIQRLHPLFTHVRYSKRLCRDLNSHLLIFTETIFKE